MRINALSQPIQTEIKKIESAKKSDKLHSTAKTQTSDHSNISEDAQRLSTTKSSIDSVNAQLALQDDIRSDRIADVRKKIQNGFYDTPEFIDTLAEKLLSEFRFKAS